jgi:hypothetical protein
VPEATRFLAEWSTTIHWEGDMRTLKMRRLYTAELCSQSDLGSLWHELAEIYTVDIYLESVLALAYWV